MLCPRKYEIAGYVLEISQEEPGFFGDSSRNFDRFACFDGGAVDWRIELHFFATSAAIFFQASMAERKQILIEALAGFTSDSLVPGHNVVLDSYAACYFDYTGRCLHVLAPFSSAPYLKPEVPLMFALANHAAMTDGIFLHAAGAVSAGRAFAIAGVPEAGKSTAIAQIGHDFLLSDDMLMLRFVADQVQLHSTPLGPNTDGPGSAPLQAVFYPVKSDHFELRPLGRLQAIEQYYRAQAGYWDKVAVQHRRRHFASVCRLFSLVRAYEMHFKKDFVDNAAVQNALSQSGM